MGGRRVQRVNVEMLKLEEAMIEDYTPKQKSRI
jgi:hypothetical protein